MAKLSEQLQEKEALKSTRPTRTQRVAQVQKVLKEKQKFESLKAQAKKIQEEKFKDKVVQEEQKYNVYRPKKYTARNWDRMRQKDKDAIMKQYQRGRGEGYYYEKGYLTIHTVKTRTVERIIPFTLEDTGDKDYSYKDVYDTLSPDLKQFFDTPKIVLQKKAERIDATKETVAEKQAYADQKIADAKIKYKEKEESNRAWYKRKSSSQRKKYYDRYKENDREIDDDLDEEIAKWQGYKKGLSKGLGELNKNKDVQISNIESYAWDLARYEEDKEEARNEGKALKRKYSGELQELSEAESWKDYAKKYSTLPDKLQDMISLKPASKKAKDIFIKREQQISLSQKGLKPIYKGKEIVGYEDAVLKMSYSADAYKSTFQKQRTDLGIKYNATTGMISVGKTPDEQYSDYLKSKKFVLYSDPKPDPKAFTLGGKTYVPTTDFIGYVDQGTISTEPKYMEIPSDLDYKKPSISAGFDWLGEQYKKIPKGKWSFNIGGITGIGLSPYKDPTALKSFDLTEKIGSARDYLSGKTTDVDKILQDLDVVEPKLSKIDTKYQEQGQARFEDLYAKQIIYGEITPEKAEKEFKKTKSYESWQTQYTKDYGETFEKAIARENIGFGSAFKYGSKKFLFSTSDFVLGRIETPKATIETSAVVGGIILTYGQLSPAVASAVGWGLTGATGVYGAYKTFDPKSTPIEVFGGSVMLGVAGATAGYGAYKYLKSPVVKTVKIKPPKSTLKASQTKGYDVKYITKEGTINKVLYQNQKLSQTGVAGRRTTVTTKWRALSNKYIKTDLKNIYEGIPTQQLAKTYSVQGVRGSYTYTAGKSGYQKAYDLLTKYGYTKYKATSTLRYTAPKVYDQYLRQGEILVKGSKAIGGFKFETVRPVIDVDKSLGIKTRGGGTTADYTLVKRQLLQNAKGQKFILENQITKTYGINLKGIKSFKQVQEKWNLGVAKVSGTQKGLDAIKLSKELTLYEKITYKDILSGSRTFLKGTGSFTKDLVKLNIEIMPKEASLSRTILIDKIKDYTKGGQFVKMGGIKKTPFSKTFGLSDNIDDVLSKITKPKISPSSDVAKIIDKLDDIKITSPTGSQAQSQFYGKGLYERSAGGVSPQQMQLLQNELKTITMPSVKVDVLKDLLHFKVKTDVASLTSMASLTALKLNIGLKTKTALKSDLKSQSDLKHLLKTDMAVKTMTATDLAIKTTPALKTQLKSMLDLSTAPINITTPVFRPPKLPVIKTPIIPKPFIIPFLKGEITKRTARGSKSAYDLAYLPDFTSRALGLKPETISEKQAQKKLKKLLTGLEVRRGVKVKW